MADTIFGKITRGEIPSEFIYEDEHCVVIRDINPQAPTPVLVIPRQPIPKLVDADPEDQALLGHLLLVAGRVAIWEWARGSAWSSTMVKGVARLCSIFIYTFLPAAQWERVNSPHSLPKYRSPRRYANESEKTA